jgi:hypothetical protein
VKIFSIIKRIRLHKYTVKQHVFMRPIRKRAFALFDIGQRPVQVCKQLPIKASACRRYWREWKRTHQNSSSRYEFLRKKIKNNRKGEVSILEFIAKYYRISTDEAMGRLRLPHGLKDLMLGEWPSPWLDEGITETEYKLRAALKLVEFAKVDKESFEDLAEVVKQLKTKCENKQPCDLKNERFSDSAGGIRRGLLPRSEPTKTMDEKRAVVIQYFIHEMHVKGGEAYRAIVAGFKLFGLSEESIVDMHYQAIMEVLGPETVAEWRNQTMGITKPVINENIAPLTRSGEAGMHEVG